MKASGPRIIDGLNSPDVGIYNRPNGTYDLVVDTWRDKQGRGKGTEENVILKFKGLSGSQLECVAFSIADALVERRQRLQQGLDDVRDRFDG